MTHKNFLAKRRAIISADDTCISAGGGVAKLLLEKAGEHNLLNEIAKFAPIAQCGVVVTSGGKLPVHYIFHAATLEIEEIGENLQYSVSVNDVYKTMTEALNKASALQVGALWVPLMGAGVAPLKPKQSLEGILEAINDWASKKHALDILIVIYKESELPRNIVRQCFTRKLDSRFFIS
jgi:O-acetyl-ADP-ribose deacetylase (regulator of RNase III)